MKWFAWSALTIFVLIAFAPLASAEVDVTGDRKYVELLPDVSLPGVTSNLLDESEVYLEETVWSDTLPEAEGRYFGPYLQSSLFQFDHTDGYIQFITMFKINSSMIMNGCTEFWVRIPLDGTCYDSFRLRIEGDGPIYSSHDAWSGYYFGMGWTNSDHAGECYFTSNGIFVLVRGIFTPHDRYVFYIYAHAKSGYAHRVWLTGEDYQLGSKEDFTFYDTQYYEDVGAKEIYRYNQTLDYQAAWSFLFLKGLGDGLSSVKLRFGDEGISYNQFKEGVFDPGTGTWLPSELDGSVSQYLVFQIATADDTIDDLTYVSIYLPFYSDCTVSWDITLICTGTGSFVDPTVGSPSAFWDNYSWVVETTNNVLLTSCPFWFNDSVGGDSRLDVVLRPYRADGSGDPLEIVFPCVIPESYVRPDYLGATMARYYSESDNQSFDTSSWYVRPNIWGWEYNYSDWFYLVPIVMVPENTDDRWAQVTQLEQYTIYDFGWGRAYLFPGETTLVMFLDNGTSKFWYDVNLATAMNKEDRSFQEWLWDAVYWLYGKIRDGITWVIEKIIGIGQFIWSNLVKFIGWIIDFTVDVLEKVSHIVEGMLYGLPILVVIFVVNYGGQMLYTGKVPRLGKERKLFRKVIKKPAKRAYRKLRYEVRGVQKSYETRRAERERARGADYRSRLKDSRARERAIVGRSEFQKRDLSIKRSQNIYKRRDRRYS